MQDKLKELGGDTSEETGEETPPKEKPAGPPKKLAASDAVVAKLSRQNRKLEIKALLDSAKITPARAKDLEKEFCSDDAIALSLSDSGDNWDLLVRQLQLNEPQFKNREQSGPQVILSDERKTTPGKKSRLVEDAEKRAAAAK
jgi:hypothetical protein